MDESEAAEASGEVAVLDSEITDLEVAVEASPFLTTWRALVAVLGSATVATVVLGATSSFTPEVPAVVSGIVSFGVFSWLLSIPERRRRAALQAQLAEAEQARQRLIAGGAS